jgi:hypothetical protein
VLLDFQPSRSQIYPQTFLGNYRDVVMRMSDDYAAWCTLEGATHTGRMAPSRRRFVDAFRSEK